MSLLPWSAELESALLERFLRYVAVCTTSSQAAADRGLMPSSAGQRVFAEALRAELAALGLEDAHVTKDGYVCARVPASPGLEAAPPICFLAHLDTSEAAPGKNVAPVVHRNYGGEPIALKGGVALNPAADQALARARGQTIIHGDGATLLGADDKAGVAIIMTALAALKASPALRHGVLEAVFSPDEETGHGMDRVPLSWLTAKAAYTFDGGQAPTLEAECFNACKCQAVFRGVARHTGSARPDMVNAVNLAADFISMLPRHESPETTDGDQGFFAPMSVSGSIERASVTVYLRDFDADALKERVQTVRALAAAVSRKYAGSGARVTCAEQYRNMKDGMAGDPRVLLLLSGAVKAVGLEPVFARIRGGTDGARLTEMGIPAPNIFTGGHNFHSRSEWASLDQMVLAVRTAVELAALWGKQ